MQAFFCRLQRPRHSKILQILNFPLNTHSSFIINGLQSPNWFRYSPQVQNWLFGFCHARNLRFVLEATHLWASQSLFPSVRGFNNFTISVKYWSIEVKNQLFWAVALSLSFDNQHLEHSLSQTHDSSKHVFWHLTRNAMRNANYRFRWLRNYHGIWKLD